MGARENDLNPDTWIGLSFPLGRSEVGMFKQTKTTLQQARHNLKNLLLTRRGERPMQPEFGSRLYSFLFEQIDEDQIRDKIEEEILNTTSVWLPYVNIVDIDVNFSERDQNVISIKISFNISLNPDVIEQIALTFESGEY